MGVFGYRRRGCACCATRGSGGTPTPPYVTADLQQWWESDNGVTKSGANRVSLWEDKTTHNRDWANESAGVGQPLWVDAQCNGYPAIRGDAVGGTIKQLICKVGGVDPAVNYLSAQTSAEVFWVVKSNQAQGAINRCLARFGASLDTPDYPFDDDDIYETFGRTDRIHYAAAAASRSYNIYHIRFDSSTPIYTVKLGGVTLYNSGAPFTAGWNTETNGFRLFSFEGTFRWLGDWVAGMVYSPAPPAPVAAAARAYLAAKYALT